MNNFGLNFLLLSLRLKLYFDPKLIMQFGRISCEFKIVLYKNNNKVSLYIQNLK
jgi:hypothetical protein